MKKLINRPEAVVEEAIEGLLALAPRSGASAGPDGHRPGRCRYGPPTPGDPDLGGRQRSRAGACGLRGAGHADRVGRRRRFHLAEPRRRARGDPCGGRAAGGPPDRQELHGGPAQLRPGRRDGPGRGIQRRACDRGRRRGSGGRRRPGSGGRDRGAPRTGRDDPGPQDRGRGRRGRPEPRRGCRRGPRRRRRRGHDGGRPERLHGPRHGCARLHPGRYRDRARAGHSW